MTDALDGVRVLDLSQGAAGPTCGMALGDLGATVIKVEPPDGEWGRGLGPPFVSGVAAAFLGMNRNKRGIAVDLKHAEGAEVVLRLAESCDVAIESFRPGVADRLGIGYEVMAERNVRLVYASVSAFGQEGPWRDRPGVDGVAQAMGGLMSITGTADGPPVKVGIPAADMAAGAYATQAILAALLARERTGLGQRVEVSLLDSALAFQAMPISMYLADEQVPKRLGSAAAYSAPNQAYATADGHVMVAAYAPKRWTALCEVLEMSELETDPRFDTNEHRVHNRWELAEVLESVFRTKTTAAWVELLDAADIICGPLLSYPELLATNHVREGGSLETVVHPVVGKITSPAFPGRLHGSDRGTSLPPPFEPGEHSREILGECGMSDREIDRFVRDGVVAAPGEQ